MLKLSEIQNSVVEKHTINELNKQKELFTEIVTESLSNLSVLEKDLFKNLKKDNSLKIEFMNLVLEKMNK
jgi:hypothetical protein